MPDSEHLAPEYADPLLEEVVRQFPFPPAGAANALGLLAYGGDLGPERLLSAYAQGVFPWYEDGPILWFHPDPRMVLLPSELHVGRSLAKRLRNSPFEIRVDTAFDAVIEACAAVPRAAQTGTWITAEMIRAYCQLHVLGFAHSVEAWQDGELAGGLYGVSLGAAFFGESMFAQRADASKVATVALVEQLARWKFEFVDCQVYTEHLARFGAKEWSRKRFLEALAAALRVPSRKGRWQFDAQPATDAAG